MEDLDWYTQDSTWYPGNPSCSPYYTNDPESHSLPDALHHVWNIKFEILRVYFKFIWNIIFPYGIGLLIIAEILRVVKNRVFEHYFRVSRATTNKVDVALVASVDRDAAKAIRAAERAAKHLAAEFAEEIAERVGAKITRVMVEHLISGAETADATNGMSDTQKRTKSGDNGEHGKSVARMVAPEATPNRKRVQRTRVKGTKKVKLKEQDSRNRDK